MKKYLMFWLFIIMLVQYQKVYAQAEDFTAVRAKVDFLEKLRVWDGFGFNYVETAHTYDYDEFPQEYGGFSILNDSQKKEVIELVFGSNGLKVGLVKMFFGPLHQNERNGKFDHETHTANQRYFVREGLKKTRERGNDLQIITTLYGPPPFMTIQKDAHRGRDLDPEYKPDLANYMIDWIKFLKEKEKFPVKYLSLHNEGEDWSRWNQKGYTDYSGHDYNLYWSPEMVNEFVKMMPPLFKKAGIGDVGITPGEPTNWFRFHAWGYADALAKDTEAVNSLGLITSHGFYNGGFNPWYGSHNPYTNRVIQQQRPELHSWVTSTSWRQMNATFIFEMHQNIYATGVNAIIPWAGIQRPTQWVGGDPNPGCAIAVAEDGTYEVKRGYYFYKQITRAGQPGMAVVNTYAMNSETSIIGFASNGTNNPNAFVVINTSNKNRKVAVEISGTNDKTFEGFCTSADEDNNLVDAYKSIGDYPVINGKLIYHAPAGSVSTFFGK
jgi:hypothetical protein